MSNKTRKLVERLATMPLSTEDTHSTWCPPDWEDIVAWWDDAVCDARDMTGKAYRDGDNGESARMNRKLRALR